MSRWLPWLAELQPELFIEMGKALAAEKGIRNLDWVIVSSPRGHIAAKAARDGSHRRDAHRREVDPPRRYAVALGLERLVPAMWS